jgi:integrase
MIQNAWSHDTFRKYRRTLTRVAAYLKKQGKEERLLINRETAQWVVADFLTDSAAVHSEAVVQEMSGHLRRVVDLFDDRSEHSIVRMVTRAISRSAPTKSRRYDAIWDLDQLLSWLEQSWGDNERIPLDDLQTKTMLVVMIFSACRLAELGRMERPRDVGVDPTEIVLYTIQKQKQTQREQLVIRRISQTALCPVHTLMAWLRRAPAAPDGFLFYRLGGGGAPRAMTTPYICPRFLKAMKSAGIPNHYTAYSVKHAVVTKLYNLGASDEEVCTYGHWKQGSHTPRQWYYIPTIEQDWLGARIGDSYAQALKQAVLERGAQEARGSAAEEK